MFSNWELTVGGLKVMQHALAIASLHGLVLFPGSPLHMGEPRMKLLRIRHWMVLLYWGSI